MKQMTLLIALLGITLMFNQAYGQIPFPDETDGQKWEYVTWYFWGGKCEARIIKTGNKVQKCSMDYIEVWDCNDNESNCYLLGYYRLQGDSVLVRTNYQYLNGTTDTVVCAEQEGLMYDFSTSLNDTMICQMNSTWPSTFTKFWETSKQFIEYEGIERQTTNLKYIPHPHVSDLFYGMKWVEGIGSNVHPFYSFSCIGDHCELEQQLTKVFKNEQLIYQDTTLKFLFPCTGWITSTHNDNQLNPSVTILPNPAKSFITIRSEGMNKDAARINICDVQGKVLSHLDQYIFGDPINIASLSAGMYIIQVLDGNHIQTLTFIKE